MSIIVVGTNHKHSPIAIREKLSFSKRGVEEALFSLLGFPGIKAAVILSTCNRVELYANVQDAQGGTRVLKKFFSDYHQQSLLNLDPYLYTFVDKEAMQHLFNVACGIDSQIIGESQILEQVRLAHYQAKAIEATDRTLDFIFAEAIKTSLQVRQETGVFQDKISIADMVADLIKRRCSFLKDKKILIIGVGKISELVINSLRQEQTRTVFIANRSYQKAVQLARGIGAEVLNFKHLKEKLRESDIVISATSSPHLILRKEDLTGIHKPLLIIDLAVPRDVDPAVKSIRGISLFCVDDLDFIIEEKLEKRKQELPRILGIIKQEVENLCLTGHLELEPAPVP